MVKGLQYRLVGVARLFLAWILMAMSVGVIAAPSDFDEAKRLAERVYSDHPEEFYCGCRITWRNGGKDLVDLQACGYRVRKDPVRAQRIEWEHVVPASWFGQPMACWRDGGRENCSKRDATFKRMEADLHNLTPSVGEVNGDRSNLPFGQVAPEQGRYGKCTTRVDMVSGRVEPRDAVKGDTARIAFYMMDRYDVKIDAAQVALLRQWAEQDPVDAWERERDRRIGQHMGWRNPYVAQAGKIALPVVKSPLPHDTPVDAPAAVLKKLPAGLPLQEASTPGEVRGNRNSKLYHLSHCPGFPLIKPANRVAFASTAEAEAQGYQRAKNCH